jgi:hypothetical protein
MLRDKAGRKQKVYKTSGIYSMFVMPNGLIFCILWTYKKMQSGSQEGAAIAFALFFILQLYKVM